MEHFSELLFQRLPQVNLLCTCSSSCFLTSWESHEYHITPPTCVPICFLTSWESHEYHITPPTCVPICFLTSWESHEYHITPPTCVPICFLTSWESHEYHTTPLNYRSPHQQCISSSRWEPPPCCHCPHWDHGTHLVANLQWAVLSTLQTQEINSLDLWSVMWGAVRKERQLWLHNLVVFTKVLLHVI